MLASLDNSLEPARSSQNISVHLNNLSSEDYIQPAIGWFGCTCFDDVSVSVSEYLVVQNILSVSQI